MSDLEDRLARLSPEKRALIERRLAQQRAAAAAQPIPRRDAGAPLPVSAAQRRLWFLARLAPDAASYTIGTHLAIDGPLDVPSLAAALDEVVRRHEALRTNVVERGGELLQVIAPPRAGVLAIVDLAVRPDRDAEAARLSDEEARRPFDVEREPLFRATLLRLDPGHHRLLLTAHHLISDGWSTTVLLRELSTLYRAHHAGAASPLPELALQFGDVSEHQRRRLTDDVLAPDLLHWKAHLRGAPDRLDFPVDRPPAPVPRHRGARESILLPAPLASAVSALCRRLGITLYTGLLTAFQILLHRWSGQDDLVVGTPVVGRNRPEIEALIGLFIDTVPLRSDISFGPTFAAHARRAQASLLDALAHAELPFERLVEALAPARSLQHAPIFQVLFRLHDDAPPILDLPDLSLTSLDVDNGAADLDLSLAFTPSPDGLVGVLRYDTDLFDPSTIRRLLGHLPVLLQGAVADPDRSIHALPLLTPAERRALLAPWHDAPSPIPEATIHALFHAQVTRTPDAPALVFEGRATSYRALDARAHQLARRLIALGAGPGARVGVALHRSPDLVAALLAVLAIGAAYVPLDPSYPQDRLSFMLADAAARVLITERKLLASLPAPDALVLVIDDAIDDAIDDPPAPRLDPRGTASDLAYAIYTSGSTGRPKAVLAGHRSAINRFAWMWAAHPFAPGERCCQKTTIGFVDSIWEIFGPLLAGVPSVLLPEAVAQDVPRLVDALASSGTTRLIVVPSLLRAMLDLSPDVPRRLASVRHWTSSGEALPVDLARRFLQAFPRATLLNLYGSSEVAADVTCLAVREEHLGERVSIGAPIANARVCVLSAHRELQPIGVSGEIHVGGAPLAEGYLNRPELTEARFVRDPFCDDPTARLFATGDRGRRRADGTFELLGRIDHQVKIRGQRIEPGEIEAVLAEHAQVRQAVVVARAGVAGDARLVAHVVPADPAARLVPDELRRHLRRTLPESMIPAAFVALDALPLLPNGKVDRAALPSEDRASAELAASVAPPRDAIELEIAAIFRRVLDRREVSVDASFFDLGGHSLLAVRLLAAIDRRVSTRIALVDLFQHQTVSQLAALIRAGGGARRDFSLVPIQPTGKKRPLFLISRPNVNSLGYVALTRHLDPDRPVYGLQYEYPEEESLGRPYTHEEYLTWAGRYVETIRLLQPEGPYLFGGMCEGALIAFVMTRLLESQGDEVKLLAMLDAWPQENTSRPLLRRVFIYERDLRAFLDRARSDPRGLLAHLLDRSVDRGGDRVPDRPSIARTAEPSARRLWDERLFPGESFVPPRVTARIAVFAVDDQPYWRVRDALLGWGDRTTGPVEVHPVPGDHVTLLREPHVAGTARALDACIRRVDGG